MFLAKACKASCGLWRSARCGKLRPCAQAADGKISCQALLQREGRLASRIQGRWPGREGARPEPMQHSQCLPRTLAGQGSTAKSWPNRPQTGAETPAREAHNKATVALCCVCRVVSFAFTRHVLEKNQGKKRDYELSQTFT